MINTNKTYRSIFKWGNSRQEKKLEDRYKILLKKVFGNDCDEENWKYLRGDSTVKLKIRSKLTGSNFLNLEKIVGKGNMINDDLSRADHAYGKTYLDLIRLRLGIFDSCPDAVVYPRNEDDVVKILNYCDKKKIAIVPFGGHSSVTRGVECPFGGISLDLTRHMNQVLQVDEMNGSARVQPGIFGPALETFLNHFGRGYTCGHFPQSFEFSTLGGWIATRGAGQQSTGYGKIEDIVLSLRLVTPRGILRTKDYPRKALGPEINQILIGSEGAFGVITEAVIRVRKYRPENRRYFSFLFKTWEQAVDAMREVVQSEFGFPSLLRLSDPEETDIGFKLQNLDRNFMDTGLSLLGYRSRQRCLMLGMTEGDPDQGKLIKDKVFQICKRKGGLPLGRLPVDAWYSQRYSNAYLRDPLMDMGIMTDTLETAVSWKNLIPVWEAVRRYIKSRERTICMIHISHVYETGANLYFTFLTPIQKGNEIKDYLGFQRGIIDAIHQSGGSLSHHHGIGKMLAPWMEKEIGKEGLKLYQAIKDDLDPNGIMNPGRTLGLKDQIGKGKRTINNQKSFFRKT